MFDLIPLKRKEIKFTSNPPILEMVIPEPKEVNGKIRNSFRRVPASNRSILSDLIYSDSSMSLSAKLNLGLPMSVVPNPNLDSFDTAYRKASRLSLQIEDKLARLQQEENELLAKPTDSAQSTESSKS